MQQLSRETCSLFGSFCSFLKHRGHTLKRYYQEPSVGAEPGTSLFGGQQHILHTLEFGTHYVAIYSKCTLSIYLYFTV